MKDRKKNGFFQRFLWQEWRKGEPHDASWHHGATTRENKVGRNTLTEMYTRRPSQRSTSGCPKTTDSRSGFPSQKRRELWATATHNKDFSTVWRTDVLMGTHMNDRCTVSRKNRSYSKKIKMIRVGLKTIICLEVYKVSFWCNKKSRFAHRTSQILKILWTAQSVQVVESVQESAFACFRRTKCRLF